MYILTNVMNGIGWDHELLWQFATSHGLDRRAFLGLLASGGAAAVFAACGADPASPDTYSGDTDPDTPSSASGPWPKNPEPFITRDDKALETRNGAPTLDKPGPTPIYQDTNPLAPGPGSRSFGTLWREITPSRPALTMTQETPNPTQCR